MTDQPDSQPFGAPPKMLTAAEIRAAADLPSKVVEVPEWGGAVTLRAPNIGEFQRIIGSGVTAEDAMEGSKRLLVAMCEQLDEDAVQWLDEKSPTVVTRLLKEARELMPVGPAEVPAAEATFPPEAGAAE